MSAKNNATPSLDAKVTTPNKEEVTIPPSPPTTESERKLEMLHKAQIDSCMGTEKPKDTSKEKVPTQRTLLSPASCTHRYVLEIWIKVETSPGVYSFPEEETYSTDFVIDTLKMAYPGCTGVYLAEAGHVIAFYGRKVAFRVGLTVEQGMAACHILAEIPTWMGSHASHVVRSN